MSSKQLSFVVDEETLALLDELKKELKAPTTISVFRKALALTKLAVDQTKDDNGKSKDAMATITLRSQKDQPGKCETSIALRA